MSERAAAFGNLNPKKTISHNGKVYEFSPVLTEGTLSRIEQRCYDRAKSALKSVRDLLPEGEYFSRVSELAKSHERGDFAFTNPKMLEHFQTKEGSLLVLSCMADADQGEMLDLLLHRGEELQEVLEDALSLSFPDPKS